jgi:hypothetical protein
LPTLALSGLHDLELPLKARPPLLELGEPPAGVRELSLQRVG